MTAIVRTKKEMPEYMQFSYFGKDNRGSYGFVMEMQRKMGEEISIMQTGKKLMPLYDYIDDEGYCYREEWLKEIIK